MAFIGSMVRGSGAHANYSSYLDQIIQFFERVPALESHALAVYLRGSLARGDLVLGSSDIDLVVVLGEDNVEGERKVLEELRRFVACRATWGLSDISVPKVTTATAWRALDHCLPAEYGFWTVAHGQMLIGTPVIDSGWMAESSSFAQDARDGLLRHFVRLQFCLTQLLKLRPPSRARRWIERSTIRFLRAALWVACGAFVSIRDEIKRLATRFFGAWVTDFFEGRLAWWDGWQRLADLYRELEPPTDDDVSYPEPIAFFEWRSLWQVPSPFGWTGFIACAEKCGSAMDQVHRLFAEHHQVALLPPSALSAHLRRIVPHSALALPQGTRPQIALSDLDREARQRLAYHDFNWRNMYLEWPEAGGLSSVRKLGLRLTATLEAMLTLETGEVAVTPEGVLAIRRSLAGTNERTFVESFVEPALRGEADPEVWRTLMPEFARSLGALPAANRTLRIRR